MFASRKAGAGLAVVAITTVIVFATGASASASPPSNDSYSHAVVIPATGHTFIGMNNAEATTESGEKTTFTETGYKKIWNTVWAKWTAPASGMIEVDTNGSGDYLDTALAIYSSATSLSKSTHLAWDDDTTKLTNHLWSEIPSFAVTKGTTYYFQAGTASVAAGGNTGSIYVSVNPTYSPPSNDNAANAIAETASSFSVSAGDFGSTLESWETVAVRDSIWYKFTPASTGSLSVNTNGSTVDSYVSIWELHASGDVPSGDLSLVTTDFDSGTDGNAAASVAMLNAGSTYYIAVGTESGSEGTIKLSVAENILGPSVTKISPASGTAKGGTKVTISGARLTDVNQVNFGSESASATKITVVSSKEIVVTTPAVAAKGKVYVQLNTSTGMQSVVNTPSHYTYS